MDSTQYWQEMFDKLLDISSRKIAELETEKELIETRLSEATIHDKSMKTGNTQHKGTL